MDKNFHTSTPSTPSSIYYYGVSYTEWENLHYFEAIKKRKELAKNLYSKLLDEGNLKKLSYPEEVRLQKVYKAWKDNERLLDERETLVN